MLEELLKHRAFEFAVERAVFVATLHRLFVSGSDRDCSSWMADYDIAGVDGLDLHHFYRAMAWLGEELEEKPAGALAPLDRARASQLHFDYLLLTDADMELTVENPACLQDLTAAAYYVLQRSGVTYWNIRLLRRDVPASYKGVTHEYLDTGEIKNLEGIGFIDHASGSNRVEKFERDIRLLKNAMTTERDPGMIARYTFYLANSLKDSGQKAAALDAYLERSRLGLWYEEVFVSLLNAADLRVELAYPDDEVISAYMEATAACPTRAEALHGAARFCRNKANYERGYQFAAQGLTIAYPKNALFVQDWIYDYGLLDELAINAYWVGRYAECAAACDRLLSEGKLPKVHRDRILKNKSFALVKQQEAAASSSSETDTFVRLLRAARAKEEVGQAAEDVISAYMGASTACSTRAEALHGAARFCRNKGICERGYQFAAQGLTIAYPKDAPFTEPWIYEYGLLDELAVNAYWAGRYAECAAACDRLLSEGKLPKEHRDRVLKNKEFAVAKMGEIQSPSGSQSLGSASALGSAKARVNDESGIRTFDLFDTLIARRDPDPQAVFRIVEQRSGHAGFAAKRSAAEAQISAASYTLADIYAHLTAAFEVAADEADRLKALELAVEEENIFPIAETMRLLGPNDAVVSDMYHSEQDLRDILKRACNVSPARLIVSSHGKRSGRVWRELVAASPIIEHLGDNPVTDEASPKAAGIPARLTTIAHRTAIETQLADQDFTPLAKIPTPAPI